MPNVTKKELAKTLSEETGFSQADSKVMIETFLEIISDTLKDGNNIEIRGFGNFKVKTQKARTARNPKTNEEVFIEERLKPTFAPSHKLKTYINE